MRIGYHVAAALCAFVVASGFSPLRPHYTEPTTEQRYAALKFDDATFTPVNVIVCERTHYRDEFHFYSVYVQYGGKCIVGVSKDDKDEVLSYDFIPIGTHVVLKQSTIRDWWARPADTKGWAPPASQ